jgi:hypothetical protein
MFINPILWTIQTMVIEPKSQYTLFRTYNTWIKITNELILYHVYNASIPFTHKNEKLFLNKMSQPHFGQSVRMRLTLPKVGTWSPLGLPQLQNSTTEGKTPRLEVFFILLEKSWSVNVQNGLAWAIWTSAAQVMGKRRAGSQTVSLTPD